jgi:hypothetical protein
MKEINLTEEQKELNKLIGISKIITFMIEKIEEDSKNAERSKSISCGNGK